MKRILAAVLVGVLGLGLLATSAQTAPKPSPVPVQWELDIDVQAPKPIKVSVAGEAKPRLFWYMTYTVSNHSGADQVFVPEFVLYTDTGEVLRSGTNVPVSVFGAVQKVANDPHLRDTIGVVGPLLQGDDNAKTGVAIWPDFDPLAGAFDIFIGGLSGETAQLTSLPASIPTAQTDLKGNTVTTSKNSLILSKTLDLKYKVPGEAANRIRVVPTLVSREWVMR